MAKSTFTKRRNQDAINNTGRNIRKYRKLSGLTMIQLAYLMDVDEKQVSRMELGLTDSNITMLSLVAEHLKIDVAQLFEKE